MGSGGLNDANEKIWNSELTVCSVFFVCGASVFLRERDRVLKMGRK